MVDSRDRERERDDARRWRPPDSRGWNQRGDRRDFPARPPHLPPPRRPPPPPPSRRHAADDPREERRGLPLRPPLANDPRDKSRGLPHRSPPPSRRSPSPSPPPPPPRHAADHGRGENRSSARAREEAARADAGDTGRGGAAAARRNAARGADRDRARAVSGPAHAREEQGSGEAGRKRRLASPEEQPAPKRRAVSANSRVPADWCKEEAVPLGRNRDAHGSRPRPARAADAGSGGREKAAPHPPLVSSKDGVLLGAVPPKASGTSAPNKVSAADGAAPRSGGEHRGAGSWGTKSSEAPRRSAVPAADGLLDSDSQGAVEYSVKDRGRGAGTGELRRKELVPAARLPSKPRMGSANGQFEPGSTETSVGPSYGAVQDEGLEKGKNTSKVYPVEARHSSNEKTSENKLQSEEKRASQSVEKHAKVTNKSGGSSCNIAHKSSDECPSKEHRRDRMVREFGRMNSRGSGPAGLSNQSTMMRNKFVLAPGKAAKPATVIEKSKDTGKETKHGSPVFGNRFLNRHGVTTDHVIHASMSPDKHSVAQENRRDTKRSYFGPRKKGNSKGPGFPEIKIVPASEMEKLENTRAYNLENDDTLKALAICEGKIVLYIKNSKYPPSLRHQRQHGVQNTDARSKFKMVCRRFEFICRALVHAVEQHSLNLIRGRIDTEADRAMKKLPDFTKPDPVVGTVPGIEVGDEFLYKVQLAIVGLHRRWRAGIDWTSDINGISVATSIVCSGVYPDEISRSGELTYTGSGGKPAGKKHDEDQELKLGNAALKNCIDTKTPVRVIYGFKSHNVRRGSHSRGKMISTYTYGGLYHVEACVPDYEHGSKMFKFKLQKVPGQPELPLHIAKGMMKSKKRQGLCTADISKGKEGTPICVINRVDAARPAPFKYITRTKSALYPPKVRAQGCDCTNGCTNSASCSCAMKNGGKSPFNRYGAIVSELPLIFECGPSCKCPPSCRNRVGQHGIKIPLEVFRTSKTGWGVRSLRSISSGSFICEYTGELLPSTEADQRKNRDYLFNIGCSYEDGNLCKGFQPRASGLNSSGACSGTMDDVGFAIDATEYGNVGRFINHSCSPNLFAQNVLWDHGDKRMPHIMFFAAETIPPLQELTCEFKCKMDLGRYANGGTKFEHCQCGSPQCCRRLH
ncbi:hypothetical protein EJB05_49363, partial [Eragrostis curvula]